MYQSSQLVVGRTVKVTEFLMADRRLQSQPLGDVRFRVDVIGSVVLLSGCVTWEPPKPLELDEKPCEASGPKT